MIEEIGKKLKAKREEMGLTIPEVSLALKINTRTLKAIEDNDVDNLPPRTFLRGFIQSYSLYLKLDSEALLKSFQESGAPKIVVTEQVPTPEQEPAKTKTAKNPLDFIQPKSKTASIFMGIFAVILVVAIFGLLRTIEKYQTESQKQPIENVESIPENTPTTAEATKPSGEGTEATTEEAETSAATENETTTAPTTPPATAKAPVAAPTPPTPPPPPPPPEKKPEPAKPVVEKKPEPAKPAEVKTAEAPAAATAETPQEVIIEALDKVTLEYEIDDQPKQKVQMNPEELRTLKGKKSLKIKVSDGGAVSIVHNGRDRGVPGNLGQALTLAFPKK